VSREDRYRDHVDRIRSLVRATVPADAQVLVVSRGDDALLLLDGRRSGHFPQTVTGLYAGHYPADGREAAEHLEELRAAGAEYLVVPAEARWWLEHYPELRTALEERGELLPGDPDTALIYALTRKAAKAGGLPWRLEAARTAPPVGSLLRALLPERAGVVLIGPAAEEVEVGDRPCWRLPAEPVDAVVEEAEAACSTGARFVVLLHPDRAGDALDARLRGTFDDRLRPVSRQGLAEIFEVRHG
jgi:hypothetical protein